MNKKKLIKKKPTQKAYVSLNDNTRVGRYRPENNEGIRGAKIMSDWRKENPNIAFIGDVLGSTPLMMATSPFSTEALAGGAAGLMGYNFDDALGVTESFNKYAGTNLPPGTLGGLISAGLSINNLKNIPEITASPMVHSGSEYLKALKYTFTK